MRSEWRVAVGRKIGKKLVAFHLTGGIDNGTAFRLSFRRLLTSPPVGEEHGVPDLLRELLQGEGKMKKDEEMVDNGRFVGSNPPMRVLDWLFGHTAKRPGSRPLPLAPVPGTPLLSPE